MRITLSESDSRSVYMEPVILSCPSETSTGRYPETLEPVHRFTPHVFVAHFNTALLP
jgi:hypothetical protein